MGSSLLYNESLEAICPPTKAVYLTTFYFDSTDDNQRVLGMRDTSTSGDYIQLRTDTGNIEIVHRVGSGTVKSDDLITGFNTSQWYFVTYINEMNGNVRAYINNQIKLI